MNKTYLKPAKHLETRRHHARQKTAVFRYVLFLIGLIALCGNKGIAANLINENIQSWTAHAAYGTWTQAITAGTVNMTACLVSPAAAASGTGSIGRVQMQATTGVIELPSLPSVGIAEFHIAAGAAGRSVKLQIFDGSTWVDLTTFSGIGTTGATFSYTLNSSSSTRLRLSSPSAALYVHDIIITDYSVSCTPPTGQATNFGTNTITATGMNVTWTRGDGTAGVIVVARAGSAVNTDPTSGTTYTANPAFGSGTQIGTGNYVVYQGAGTSVTVTGLSNATTYHFAIYEYNTSGTCYNTTELTGNATTLCTEPATQASGFTSSAITASGMTIGWTRGNGTEGVLVVARAGSPVDQDPTAGTTYTASAAFGSGSQIGSGNYVVYKGTGTSVAVTGLSESTTYYFALYEYNTGLCFNLAELTGSATTTSTSACGTETFNGGITPPNGWSFTGIGTTYLSSACSGGTSLKFDATGDAVETATVNNPTALSFNILGNGLSAPNTTSELLVQGYNGAWVTIENITGTGLTNTCQNKSYTSGLGSYTKFKFTYTKGTGNLSFDDVSITCGAAGPTITVGSITNFGGVCTGATSEEKSYTVSGSNLTANIIITPPANFEISKTSGSGFKANPDTLQVPQSGGTVAPCTIYVRFKPTAVQAYSGNITHTSTGATLKNVVVSGSGVSGPVITNNPANQSVSNGGNASFNVAVSNTSATYQWQENQSGTWANLTDGGIYSGVNTNSLALSGVSGAMSGFMYQCIVTSCATNVTSASATLTITSGSSLCGLEEFDNGTTPPSGWTFKSIGGTYTTATNYGISSPSLKFDATLDSVITANVSNVTELSVWVKGMGTTFKSKLYIDGYNSATSSWENIALIGGTNGTNEIPTTGTIFTFTSVSSYSKFSFSYDQGTQGNLGLDDVNITCTSSNTITTGTVSTPPFGCNCTTGASGTVSFTSSGTFTSNTYYAQLSNASGSFASPINIGTLVSNANSGTINITIPPGTPTGSNYLIRVISNGPWSIGSFSAPFTVNLTGGPCSFFEIESVLVDACEPAGGWEGENEMFRFKVGATNLNTSDISVTWPNNPWLGICQNATTAATVAAINATITAGGQLIEPTGGVLPAGSEVMFFTNTSFNYTLFDFSQLNYTLYAIFQCPDNHPGHFVNYNATPGTFRTLTLNFAGFGSDAVTYDAHSVYNGDGATVDYDVPGNPTYSPSGSCQTVPIFSPLPVSLLAFSANCKNNVTTLSWSTSSETNNDYFTIDRSDNTYNWRQIGNIKGSGNSNSVKNYSYIDKDPTSGTSYYRLKQTDYDGKSETFSPVAVICGGITGGEEISYYPNPFTSEIMVNLSNVDFKNAVIRVYDMLGNMVFEKNLTAADAETQSTKLNLTYLKVGIYMVEFKSESFTNIAKIVKNNFSSKY